jgi:hypothetical protein
MKVADSIIVASEWLEVLKRLRDARCSDLGVTFLAELRATQKPASVNRRALPSNALGTGRNQAR